MHSNCVRDAIMVQSAGVPIIIMTIEEPLDLSEVLKDLGMSA